MRQGRKPREINHADGRAPGGAGAVAGGTSEQILGEIRDFCRATQTAKSTFGRLVVNDGKLVSRLRDGAKITTGTLDKVRAYLSEHRPPRRPTAMRADGVHKARERRSAGDRHGAGGLPLLRQPAEISAVRLDLQREDRDRQPGLAGTCDLQPSPPALRLFDAGVGDGTVLSRVMRALHARFPTMPLYVVAKEITYEDVRMMLEKMADRLFEHPATVLVVTNLYYAEAPWLTPRSVTSAQGLIWKDVALSGNTAHGFAEQIGQLEGFLAENWRAGISPKTGNPVYQRPIVLTLRREDHSFLLDPIMPRPGRVMADYDLVIASQPYRARASVEFKASKVVTPLVKALRPGGRLIGIHSHGHDPGMEIIDQVWPGDDPFKTDRYAMLRQVKHELGSAARHYNFNASSDARSIFRYHMHTLPDEVSGPIGTSTLFAAWNAAIYVAQIEDNQAVRSGARRPLSRSHRPRAEEAWRALVQRRDLCDLAPPRAGLSGRRRDRIRSCTIRRSRRAAACGLASKSPRTDTSCGSCATISPPAPMSPSPSCPATIIATMSRQRRPCAAPASIRCRISPRAKSPRARCSTISWRGCAARPMSRRVLLIAGDVAAAKGPFKSSRDVGASGLLEAHGIARVSVAGHPEGHPFLDQAATLAGAAGVERLGTGGRHPRRCCHAILLRERADPAIFWRARRARHRPAGHRRPGGTGDAGDTDKIRAPLRHRQFDARAARPDRPLRPASDRYRAGRGDAGTAKSAPRAATAADRRLPSLSRSADCASPPTGCATIPRPPASRLSRLRFSGLIQNP